MFLEFLNFLFINIKKKNNIEDNLIYIGENNLSDILSEIPATFVLVQMGTDKDERFKDRADFISISTSLGTRCIFAIMDGDRNTKFCKSVNQKEQKGFYFFRYGHLIGRYSGKTDTDHLIDFVMSRTGIPFKTFEDFVIAQDFIESNEYSVILYLEQAKGPLFEKYNQLSNQLRDNFTFGLCTDEFLADELGIQKLPSLVLYRSVDLAKVIFEESLKDSSIEDITEWLRYNLLPSFETFSIFNQNIYKGGKPIILFFTPVEEIKRDNTLKLITNLSKIFNQDLRFTQIDAVSGNRFMTNMGFSKYADPAVCILVYGLDKTYKYLYPEEDEWNIETLSNFIENFLDNKLKPLIKSSILPIENNGPIIEINTNKFQEEVILCSKNVFVLYYENWDHIYQSFLPIYLELAEKLKDFIKFTQISVADNDLIYGPDPKKTPFLYLFVDKLKSKPIPFIGNLKKELILDFIYNELEIKIDI